MNCRNSSTPNPRRTWAWLKSGLFGAALALFGTAQAQVDVTATAGTLSQSYTTLGGAFTAINAGTHQGVITIGISANTTETASAILNSGAVAPAAWTSMSITPTGSAWIIEGTIAGAVVKLNGADNVTIDGRIAGTGRNLTIRNNSTATTTAAIWLASVAAGNGCTGNTIRNCEIACGALQNTGANNTWGIIMSGTTISNTSNGTDNDNNTFQENRIIRVRHGIVTRGTTTNLNENIQVIDNIIGPTAHGADQIGIVGILMQADNNSVVRGNTVQFVGGPFANTSAGADRVGIGIGTNTWGLTSTTTITSTNYTVTRNLIHDIIEERTFSAVGMVLGTTNGGLATNNLVCSNIIYNVRSNGTLGDGTCGIGISGGHSDQVVFNSIRLSGDVDPDAAAAATTMFGSGIRTSNTAATHTNLTLKNNVVYMDLSSSSAPAVRFYCVTGTAAGYLWGTGSSNNNDFFYNTSNPQCLTGGLATVTGATATTQFTTLANWQTAYTVPQDANSIQADPGFVSSTDLHISPGSTAVDNLGTTSGVTCAIDFDNEARSVTTPDIGADEYAPLVCAGADGGTITPATATACAGGTYVMTSTGSTVAAGITNQWQVSLTPGGPYSPVVGGSGATTTSYTTGPLVAGTYYYVMTNTCSFGGVDDSNELTLTVNPTPTATAGNNGPVCAGQSLDLTGTTDIGTTFNWTGPQSFTSSSQNPNVSASATLAMAGTYVFTATAAGCTSAPSNTVVEVNPAPIISSTTADPNPTCFNGTSQLNVDATAALPFVRITEITFFRTGTGQTPTYPAYVDAGINDFVELNNTSSVPADISGWTFSDHPSAGVTNNHPALTFAPGTIIPANGVLVIGLGTGVNSPANNYYVTGGSSDFYSSGGLACFVLKNGSTVIDAVATNGATFAGALGVTAGDWSGSAVALSGNAGTVRTAANDSNTGADWTTSSTAAQSIGTFNAGYNNPFVGTITSYLWTPNTFLTADNIANPVANGVNVASQAYSVLVTADNGCTSTGNVTLTTSAPITAATISGTLSFCTGGNTTLTAVPTDGAGPYTYLWSPNGETTNAITVTAAGSYSCQVSDNCGGSVNTGGVTVVENPIPTATAGSNSPVCVGTSLDLTGTTDIGTTFSWTGPLSFTSSSQNPNVSASATLTMAGTYVFTATAAGCTSAPSNTVVVVNPNPVITSATATPATVCPGGNSQLNVVSSTGTEFMSVVPITYAPVVGSGTAITTWGAGGDLTNDDGFGAAITLPFSFTLDGATFTQAWVSANGYLTFQDPVAVTAAQARTSSNMNSNTVPNAVVALCFADLIASSGTVSTFTVGAPGSQIFVLDYTNVPFFNVTGSVSGQILLYEGTNIIEVHVTSVSHGTSTSPNALGVENGAGTARAFAPGRSPAVWNVAAPEAWRFAPASNTISWSPADFLSSTTIANPVATGVIAATNYTVTVTNSLNCTAQSSVPVALAVLDDGDPCTLDACVDGVVTNTFQDTDGDGLCDANDPCPNLANLVNGDPCDDGNVCTINDVVTGCVCAGTFEDTDSDGVCDANDNCPTVPGQLGSTCDDGNPLTTGDVLIAGCICQGNLVDCEGTPAGPAVPGSPCNDNDVCTLNDIWSPSCVCAGTFTDTDSDGICDTNDNCPTFPGVQGDPCTDGDPCTINDVITAGCVCEGTPAPVTAGVTASAANYCTPGPGVTLTATGGDTYSWSPATGLSSTTGSPVTATPGTPTTYTVTATNLAGCSDTETILVGSGAFPATPVMSATPSTVCPGSNSQLVAAIGGAAPSYCTTSYSTGTGFGDYLTSVVIPGTTLNNATGASPTPFYTLYPASGSTTATLTAGTAYTLTAVAGTFGSNDVAAWIDYNKDGVFQAGEKLGEVDNFGATPAVATIPFTVPLSALNGTTRMRVREADQSSTGAMPACGSLSFGEVEDYDVTITGGASNCAAGINFSWSPTTFLSDPLICNPVATAVTAATTYTVTATNASGCFSTNTVSVAVETADADGDGTADCADGCPADPNKIAPGQCGCGVADTDADSDGTADCNDLCPADPLKIAPGICGCGVADTDTDGDLTADCNDLCPLDPNKTAPGQCGCGVADTDGDGDGIADCNDLCPLIAGTVGTACDDGNAGTINDQITAECVCAGTTPSCAFNTVLLDLTTDGSGSETSWDVVNVGTTTAVCSGSGYLNNQVITLDCCLPDGCYELRVFDSAGDGMANGTVGGYVLRTASGSRIIDNGGDGIFTSTSQVALNLGFCVPLSTDGVIAAHCDKVDWLPGDIIQAQPISAVTAQFGVTNATSGYWYWFFNPDGGYTRRILLTHANPGTVTGAPSNIRASFLRLSDMVTQPLPYFTNLNVRVRRQVAGVVGAFGPACRFRLDPPCSTTQLTVVADPVASCGATGLTRSSTIYASTVAGANLYQFEFSRPGYTRRITSPTRAQVLNFVTFPLQLNTCYDVRVRMSFDGGQTYCPFGATCTITLGVATCVEGLVEQGGGDIGSLRSATMNLWPNPNDGTRVNVSLTGFDETINTVGVEVMDLNGRMVSTSTIPVQGGYMNTVLPIEQALAPGLYMVNLQVGYDRFTERLVIQ